MAAITKQLLSGSTNGMPVKVVAVASAGTTIHTAVSGTTDMDEIWIWAHNTSTAGCKLTIEWGENTDGDGDATHIEVTIPPEEGLMQVIPGLLLQNGKVVKAFAATTDVIMLTGFVNRLDY